MDNKSTSPKTKVKYVPGSRVPVAVLIDYIKEGYSTDEFLSDYPWIKLSNVKRTLNQIVKKNYPMGHVF